ncbi:MAG: M4 family metallopeptidase [Actinomycetota bacterium]
MRKGAVLLCAVLTAASVAALPASARRTPRRIMRDPATRVPSFVTGLRTRPVDLPPVAAARRVLEHDDIFGHALARLDLAPLRVEHDAVSTTVRFEQDFGGVPVWGAQYLVHLKRSNDGLTATAANGHLFTELDVPVTARIPVSVAERLARGRFATIVDAAIERHGLTILPFERGVLAHHITISGTRFRKPVKQEIFVNALTGAIAFSYDNLQSDGPVTGTGRTAHGDQVSLNLYQRGSVYEMRDRSQPMFQSNGGEITTHNAAGGSNYLGTDANIVTSTSLNLGSQHSNSGAVDAHHGAELVYEYYLALGRNSIDDQGGSIVSTVNATDNGAPLFNAYWDGDQMVYGNPDPDTMYPMSADLDVVGHELTHGVTQHSGNLAYVNQSGAMNEAYSDYFGNAIDVDASGTPMSDSGAGRIAEDLCKVPNDQFPCPLRNLNDGMTTEDYVYFLADFDSGGVHLNSTIYSGALWDIREALGGAKADPYIYKALVSHTTPLDDFVDGRNSVVAAATELGASQADLDTINAAFTTKGIVAGWDTAAGNDAQILLENVAPVGTFFSPPQVSGSRFVIGDYADKADACCEPLQLYVGNVDGSGTLTKVGEDENPNTYNDEAPDISGNRVVWSHITQDARGRFDADIHTRVIGGGVRTVEGTRGFQLTPSVDGRLIAWEDDRGRNPHIWAKRLGRRSRRVSPRRGVQIMPQVAGPWVAWWDLGSAFAFPHIGLKNTRTGKTVRIRGRSGALTGPPGLTDRFVYWYQDRNFDGIGSIMRARLDGTGKKAIVREGHELAPIWALIAPPPVPVANGRYVTYSDEFGYAVAGSGGFPNDEVGRDVWRVAASGGRPVRVTNNRGDQAYPSITPTSRVLWLDSSQSRTDLMTRVLP